MANEIILWRQERDRSWTVVTVVDDMTQAVAEADADRQSIDWEAKYVAIPEGQNPEIYSD